MEKLLTNFSIEQIFLFLLFLLFGIKEIWSTVDYIKTQISKKYIKDDNEKEIQNKLEEEIHDCETQLVTQEHKQVILNQEIKELKQSMDANFAKQQIILNLLVESDKDDIKSWIVQQYHYFVEDKQWIDDFSLDTIEKRYAHYVDEGGNTYIAGLMSDIRSLPKRRPQRERD